MEGSNSFAGKSYLTPYLKRIFCNALMQPYFDYASLA